MTTTIETLLGLDDELERHTFPRLSKWWRETLLRFYLSGKRQCVLRVGRRGGKSSSLCRVAVCEAVFGNHTVTPGDIGVVAIISVSRDEAAQRVRMVKSILDALGIRYRPIEHGIELEGRPIAIKTYVASVAGVSGFTAVCVIADEVAKWRDADTGANPAKEVLASLRPTMATMPSAKLFLSSSAFGPDDAHATAFNDGETAFQCVAFAPTWIANTTISEDDTMALEPDEKVRLREYGAIPQGSTTLAFDPETIARAIRRLPPIASRGKPVFLTDSSAGSGDSWTWGLAAFVRPAGSNAQHRYVMLDALDHFGNVTAREVTPKRDEDGNPVPNPNFGRAAPQLLYVYGLGALDGKFAVDVDSDRVVEILTTAARKGGATRAYSDPYQSFFLSTGFAKKGIAHTPMTWTNESKVDAVAKLRGWFRDDRIVIEPGAEAEKLRAELGRFQEKILPSGAISYGARRGGHDDRVALLLNAAMADVDGAIDGSPNQQNRGRIAYSDTAYSFG